MTDLLCWSGDRRFGLQVKDPFVKRMLDECGKAYPEETGGILIGYYTPEHDCAVVTELSGPPDDSVQRMRVFHRGIQGLQVWVNALWRKKRHFYIGEWHFHPGGPPLPSGDDSAQMEELSADRKLRCPEPILLIIGGDPKADWTAAGFVYPIGNGRVPLQRDVS